MINTWSEINPCHAHFKDRADWVKRGILQAGGWPIELPALSLAELFVKPTTMLSRNMLAMEVEELLRSHPLDGAVLMGGCDKTTPGLVMGAISMGLPFVYLPAGPMLRGNFAGRSLGSGTDGFKTWDNYQAGTASKAEVDGVEAGIARSYGHCMTMGTASTMTAIAEGFGLCLSAPHRRHGLGRSDTRPDPDTISHTECGDRCHGHGLLDQCDHPSCGHGPPRRRSVRSG